MKYVTNVWCIRQIKFGILTHIKKTNNVKLFISLLLMLSKEHCT